MSSLTGVLTKTLQQLFSNRKLTIKSEEKNKRSH